MKYEDMSDFEINKRVARALGAELVAVAQDGLILDGRSASVDYCNNPSDAWPIIVENEISTWAASETDHEIGMSYSTGEWKAYCVKSIDGESCVSDDGFETSDQNPLRAAMICLLKMKDAESNAN